MRKMFIVLVSVHLLAGTAVAAPEAFATMWSSAGAGCVPGENGIQVDAYVIVAGSVALRPTATTTVTLYCPVTRIGHTAIAYMGDQPYLTFVSECPDQDYVLRMTYTDGDGRGDGGNVTAELLGITIGTGITSSTGAKLISSNVDTTVATNQAIAFNNPISLSRYYYYVRVDLSRDRRAEASPITFHGVSLECAR